ncbi:ABC transporter permease [Oscillochloris sp. ZM17-4]|uniref:ABC transporter permease n=1 Tax=Oscillochloris sp. ZM17-4 TaxID=2866714 RepID=UPI001C738DD9|nr:ABC transporter permease [Oscillochloris sp. ZM17-4]MBX0330297.1 ABC transporter permease [Oscillochloris sp. ZM17-4]
MSAIVTEKTSSSADTLMDRQKSRNLWSDAARRFAKNRLAMAAFVVVMLLIFTAVFANFLAPAPYDFAVLKDARKFPSAEHWLGTDEVGRDMLSRIIYGARISLTVGFSVQAIALVIGVSLGLAAGFLGGWVDFLIARVIEVFTAIPQVLFALFLVSIFGSSMQNVILAIALIGWVEICRLTRAQIFALREREFIEAARVIGTPNIQIMFRHLLPNALTPLIIAVTLGIPTAIFTEAGLSFLGLGINDPLPSWGKMVGNSFSYIRVYWHLGVFPTLMIAITMLSFSLVGDGLRDALDPRAKK